MDLDLDLMNKQDSAEIFLQCMREKHKVYLEEFEKYNKNQISLYRELHSFFKFYYTRKICYISDIHLSSHIIKEISENADYNIVKKYIEKVVKGLFSNIMVERVYQLDYFIFAGDISYDFKVSELFYMEFMNYLKEICKLDFERKKVFVVLGNHEYWGFNTVEDCYNAYKDLFDKLGIIFLNNSIETFDICRVVNAKKIGSVDYKTIIVGGTGFAGCNKKFNAKNGLYKNTISREQELELTKKWVETYEKAREMAKENGYKLLVITHNPISDWLDSEDLGTSCVYINGHTHHNDFIIDTDKDLFVLSDNQVGYTDSKMLFKVANFYGAVNPYVDLNNGCRETAIEDYLSFCNYIGERIQGVEIIRKSLDKGAKIYVVKYNDFYGFFVKSKDNIYICVGGRLKKINRKCTMWTVYKDFSKMIDIYLKKLTPYRKVQEDISDFVKSFGGKGTIHGSIIDIDFYNHIMLNPDGQISYYYSPDYGEVQVYENIYNLLKGHNEYLLKGYLELVGKNENNGLIVLNEMIEEDPELERIDIKNSPYSFSIRMNQLQRLFDKKVLRDWNEDLLHKEDNNILGIPKKIE